MRLKLTPDQVHQYERAGFVHPVDVLDPSEADAFRSRYEAVAALLGGAPKAVQMIQVHRFYHWAWELCTHSAVLDAVESLLGRDILLWSASVFAKIPRDPGYVTMHQDGTYWGLAGGEVTTAWIALTASTRENGCMRLLPGSHRSAILRHADTFDADNLLTRGQQVQAEYDESEVVDLQLLPGQMSLHHVRAIHGSHANTSDRSRIGLAIRYMTPDTKPERPDQGAALVRGNDCFGNWHLHGGPADFGSLERAVRKHQAEAARFVATLTRD